MREEGHRFGGDALRGLRPGLLWEHFRQISQLPRRSGDEGRVREYVVHVAKRNGLLYKIDHAGNIRVRKASSERDAAGPSVALQAHLDMVCEKANETSHDFSTDPIHLKRENDGWIGARGTTLGADNGIGVAASLAILEAPNIRHGPLEILLTVNEESGQAGVKEISPDMLESRVLLNLDSEEDDVLYAGCAGSRSTEISLAAETEPRPHGYGVVTVRLKGLEGGHSGLDIHKGRANAIKLLGRFLWNVASRTDLRLARFEGGGGLTAIPREATAVLFVPAPRVSELKREAAQQEEIYRDEFGRVDPGIVMEAGEAGGEMPAGAFSREFQKRLLCLLLSIPHGVISLSPGPHVSVRTSTNLAVLKMENGRISVGTKQRSSIESELVALSDAVGACGLLAGGEVRFLGDAPAWKPNPDSVILKAACSVYRELFRRKPQIKTLHAGLECGILGRKFPGIDMLSIGPKILGAHSPHERVQIRSVARFWRFVLAVLSRSTVTHGECKEMADRVVRE